MQMRVEKEIDELPSSSCRFSLCGRCTALRSIGFGA